MFWDLLAFSGALAFAITALRNHFWPRRQWVETSYYQWVRATRRGERTITTRHPQIGETRYWILE